MLFENQAQWAGETTYKDYLKGKAAEYGLDGPHFEACIANEALQKGIVDRVRANQQQFNISSTPSFVINNQVTVAGNRDFETFDREITEAYDSFVNSDNSEEPPLEPQP
ncbi:MAG: DsbA family protein, partial [Bdellovibrionales bacterium]